MTTEPSHHPYLCQACVGREATTPARKCQGCGQATASGEHSRCPFCARKENACARCEGQIVVSLTGGSKEEPMAQYVQCSACERRIRIKNWDNKPIICHDCE